MTFPHLTRIQGCDGVGHGRYVSGSGLRHIGPDVLPSDSEVRVYFLKRGSPASACYLPLLLHGMLSITFVIRLCFRSACARQRFPFLSPSALLDCQSVE